MKSKSRRPFPGWAKPFTASRKESSHVPDDSRGKGDGASVHFLVVFSHDNFVR
jgi:hypothetical protein